MNRLITLLTFIFIVGVGHAQCPDPTADSIQYVCTASNSELNDLNVTVGGTPVWYDDVNKTNTLPGTTTIVDGTTYYVANDGAGCESDAVPITVYEQSVEFVVSPSSCVNLGGNVFFIEEDDLSDPIVIEVLNLDGDPFDAEIIWSPIAGLGYYLEFGGNLTGPHYPFANGTLGPANPVNMVEISLDLFDEHTLNLNIPIGDGCGPSQESITLIAGALEYDDYCYGDTKTLQDIEDHYSDLLDEHTIEWYDEATGGVVLNSSHALVAGEEYYIDFGDPTCSVRIPVVVDYKVAAPSSASEHYFCSEDAWAILGKTIEETLGDIDICGANLKFYDANFTHIPATTPLVDGEIYYITDVINGCESAPLEILVMENDCGCSINNNFQTQDGTPDFRDIKVFQNPMSAYNPNFNVCNTTLLRNNQITLGAPETPGIGDGTYQTFASLVTPGWDPTLEEVGVYHPRTSPRGTSCSVYSMRLNRNFRNTGASSGIVYMEKEFVAGEVFAFDFSMVMENPTHHIGNNAEPYFQVQVMDENGQLIESRCIKADLDDCILNDAGPFAGHTYTTLYTNWSCLKVNTIEAQGQKVTARIIASTCQPDVHFAYAYVDNFYVGDDVPGICDDSAYGYVALDPVEDHNESENPYSVCSLIGRAVAEACAAAEPLVYPDFPIDIYGKYANPIGRDGEGTISSLELDILRDGVSVLPAVKPAHYRTTTQVPPNAFYFQGIDPATDFLPTIPLYGHFTTQVDIGWDLSCNQGQISDNKTASAISEGFKICPVAECVDDLEFCVDLSDIPYPVDLTVNELLAKDRYSDKQEVEVSYYDDLDEAHLGNNPIANPAIWPAPLGQNTIYLRLDYDWTYIGVQPVDNCYDIVSFEVIVSADPELPTDPIEIEYCEIDGQVDYSFDLLDTDLRDDILAQVSGVAADYVLEFYNTNAGATNQTAGDLITTPGAHIVSIANSPSQVWVRIIAPGDCWSIFAIDLIIHEAPTLLVNTWPIVECQDASNPGVGVFDLDSEINNIVDPSLGYNVDYYTDAALTTPVTNPGAHNGSDGDTIYVEVTDPATDCTSVAEITLTVVDIPVIPTLTPLELCDEGNMEAEFNLGDVEVIIQAGDATLKADFYATLPLAQAAVPGTELSSPHASGTDTVHVRVYYQGAEDCPAFGTLDLIVNPLPAIPTVLPLDLCADPSGGRVTFPLDSDTALITAILDGRPAADLDITFHDNQTDADSGSDPIIDITTGTSTSVWVRIEDITTSPSCHNTFELDLTVHPLPTLISSLESITECEDPNNPGVGIFDLESVETNIVDPTLGYDVVYFTDAGLTNPIANPGSHSGSDGDVVYVEITDPTTDCYVVAQIDLLVADAPPVPVLTPLEECDAGNGQAQFDLGGLIPYIQAGDASLIVDFYSTNAAANDPSNNPALPLTYTSGSDTIFVRVGITGLDCYAVEELQLIVNPLPSIPVIDAIQACEDLNGADITFDLTNNPGLISDILDGRAPADLTISFHSSQTNAQNNTTPIDDITTGGTETVWVRLLDTNTLCENVFSIEIKVNPLPQINSPVELRICDEAGGSGVATFNLNLATTFMVGQGSNYDVTYYLTEPEAEGGATADRLSISFTNTVAFNQTIFARIQDRTTGCYITEPILLEVDEAPEANTPDPLVYCDPNNDGIGTFHLPDANENGEITNDPNAIVTYHRTEADARLNVLPLPDTVDNNMVNINQPIWVRVELPGVNCYTLVQLMLVVEPTPDLKDPSGPLIGCDVDGSGIYTFDLTEIVDNEVMVNILNPQDYDIEYFANETDRDNNVPIAAPTAYPSGSGTILVVVTNPTTGCSSQVEIELFVAPLPEVFQPVHMEVCDVDNPGDETEFFYLDEAVQEITGGDSSLIVTFHETQADADNGDNALAIPYQNTHNNQTIYIRVENEFGCVVTDTITLTLVVNPLPDPVVPATYEVCDIDNEGFAYFDLDALENDIIGNDPDLNISFHETYSDAENSMNSLGSPYQNIVGGEQVIFIRAYFDDVPDGTGCFRVIEIVLKALPSPIVPVELDDLYFCAADMTSSVRVNLTGYEDLIYGSQDRDELDLTYHLTPEAAANASAPIADPTDFLLSPPTPVTIYVRLGYINGDCYNVVSFDLYLIEGPEINDPTALSVCSPIGEPNTETAVFDLLDKREEILGAGTTGLGIYFYEDEQDALLGNNNYIADPTNYTNTVNPQTIYVRVVDSQENEDGEGCVAFTTLTLRVDPTPEPVTPDPIEYCLLDNEEDFVRVDLTIRELQILNHESWDLEYYRRYRDAVNGDQFERIMAPEDYEIALEDSPLTIYVRVINPDTGCFEIVELEVILSTLPEVLPPEDIEPLIVCSTDNKDWALFDLTLKLPEIFGTQNLDGLDVFFYEDLEDAIDGVNPIIDPENYYNTSNPQTIYVGVGNPDIDDCYIGGLTWFDIEILEGAFAESPTETYKVCGAPGPNGGVATFDLRNEDLIESILGLQDPNFFDVDFFLSEEEAHENAAGTRLGNTYENISNPQTIYVRVTNQETGCYAIAEVVLEVIVIEELILEDLYSICTDAQGNPMQDADGNIVYPIIDTGLDIDGYTFKWFFEGERLVGQTGPFLVAEQVGSYRVEIVSLDTGCILSLDIEVVESSMPFNYGAEVTSPAFSGTYNVEAWAEGFGDYWFSIDGGAEQDHGSFTNVGIGSHVITITDRNGCGSVDVIVNVVDYPKFFTPNDDGYNDTWNIPGMAELDPSAEIFIFDRHGKLLKQLNPLSEGWDGNFNGKALPSTDYWFVVKYMEDGAPKEFKGHFSLKR